MFVFERRKAGWEVVSFVKVPSNITTESTMIFIYRDKEQQKRRETPLIINKAKIFHSILTFFCFFIFYTSYTFFVAVVVVVVIAQK